MKASNRTDSDFFEKLTPIAKSMAKAWSNNDYTSFISHFEEDKQEILDLDAFTTQRSWVEELGDYTIGKLDTFHQNPDNVVVIWKISFSNRHEPGLAVYRFTDINGIIKVKSCIYFH